MSHTATGLFGRLAARHSRALMDVVAHSAGRCVGCSPVAAVDDVDPGTTAHIHRHQKVLVTATTISRSAARTSTTRGREAARLADRAYVTFESGRPPGRGTGVPRAHRPAAE